MNDFYFNDKRAERDAINPSKGLAMIALIALSFAGALDHILKVAS